MVDGLPNESVWFVVALAGVMPSVVSPPAGTSKATPTQRARMNNRDLMVLSF